MRIARRFIFAGIVSLSLGLAVRAHDLGTTPITWNREISRIFYDRCVSCHHAGGSSFSLMNFQDAQPHAVGIKTSVLSRKMPPWGAVKGFGDFRNDQGLTQEQIELIVDWVESDTPKGNNPNVLPKKPNFSKTGVFQVPKDAITITGDRKLDRALTLGGIFPEGVRSGASSKITAILPDGRILPLLWLYEYEDRYQHPFFYRTPIDLPAGTLITGLPLGDRISFLPVRKKKS